MAEVKTFTYSNCIVRVHCPDLTEEEKLKRQKKIEKATERFMKNVEKEKRRRNEQKESKTN